MYSELLDYSYQHTFHVIAFIIISVITYSIVSYYITTKYYDIQYCEKDEYCENVEMINMEIQTEVEQPISVKAYPWKYSQNLTPSLTWAGHSRAAENTSFYCPQLNTNFDAGKQGLSSAELTVLTHGHIDHSGDLPRMNLEFKKIMTLMVPIQIKEEVENFIRSAYKVNNKYDKTHTLEKKYNVIGVTPYTTYNQALNKRSFTIEIFKCYHSVPTVGFGFNENRKRIKPEYAHLTQDEIISLRKQNIEISSIESIPIIVYIGDTSIKVLNDPKNQNIFKFPFIVIESTFFGDDDPDKATKDGHIHWNHLRPYVMSHPDNVFVIIHFSARHKDNEIQQFFENDKKIYNYNNIIPWLG